MKQVFHVFMIKVRNTVNYPAKDLEGCGGKP